MKTLLAQLQERLSKELQNISDEASAVKGYDLRRNLLEEYIKELKEYVGGHPFSDKTAEIYYYKQVAPVFYQQYFYFSMLCDLELERITKDKKDFPVILQKELENTNHFLNENHELHRYFYSGQDVQDQVLFTREKFRKRRDKRDPDMDDHYCEDSRQLSLILAHEQYRIFLNKELERPDLLPGSKQPFNVECKATKSEVVEFITAAHESIMLYINNQPATLIQMKEIIEHAWNIDLKDFTIIDNNNRSRKTKTAPFLTKLVTNYISRKKRLDEETFKKR